MKFKYSNPIHTIHKRIYLTGRWRSRKNYHSGGAITESKGNEWVLYTPKLRHHNHIQIIFFNSRYLLLCMIYNRRILILTGRTVIKRVFISFCLAYLFPVFGCFSWWDSRILIYVLEICLVYLCTSFDDPVKRSFFIFSYSFTTFTMLNVLFSIKV